MDPFAALKQFYQNALNPFHNLDHLHRLSGRLQSALEALQATEVPERRLEILEQMIRLLTSPLDSQASPGAFDPWVGTPWWAGFQSMVVRALAETLAGRTQPLSLAEWFRLLTDCAEAAYQSQVRTEAFAKTVAEAWRFWPQSTSPAAANAVPSFAAPAPAAATPPTAKPSTRRRAVRRPAAKTKATPAKTKTPPAKATSTPHPRRTKSVRSTSATRSRPASTRGAKPARAAAPKRPARAKATQR